MAEQKITSQVSIFRYLGMFFCFFAFPFFVINFSLTNLLELKLTNHKQAVSAQLGEKLKKLTPYNDERKYYHLMLQRLMKLSEQTRNPLGYLEKAIQNLKNNYPGKLEFIVWDKNGKIVEHLTDEKRFRFVIKKLWEVFCAVTSHIQSGEQSSIKDIETVKSNLNLIKHFLGRVFLPETLQYPHLTDDKGAVILADYGKNRPYFWYKTSQKSGLLCFITWELIKGENGLRNIIKAMNNSDKKTVTGFASLHNLAQPHLPAGSQFTNEVVMALARYENSTEQLIETQNLQIVVQMLNPHTRVFAYQQKEDSIYFPDQLRHRTLINLIALYLIGYSMLFFNFRIRKAFFSIRWKLLLLFLYANIAPLLALGTIAYDYLENKAVALNNDIQLESARLLRDIDTRFSVQIESYQKQLNQLLEQFNNDFRTGTINQKKIKQLKHHILPMAPDEFFLIDKTGQTTLAFGEGGKNVSHSTSYVKSLAQGILKYHNRVIVKADKTDVLSKITSPEHSDFIRNSVKDSNKLWPMSIGDAIKIGYWALIGDKKNYDNNYFLMLLWNESNMQKNFLKHEFTRIIGKHKPVKFFAKLDDQAGIYPEVDGDRSDIEIILAGATRAGSAIYGEISHNQRSYLATAVHGKKLNQTSMVAMQPKAVIDEKINQIRFHIAIGALLSILITTIISLAFARQFLEPVKTLGQAAKAVAKHNFRHRIDIREKDEFGHLGQVMNHMIEGLGELEIARIVQDSLLPEESPVVKPFDIFGKSIAMTTLGGDYYDFIDIDTEHFGVIIGDVSGHGISAALIMAMAKAGVKMASPHERTDPAAMLKEIHRILYSLKNRKLQRMMTFQYLVINRFSGHTSFANAGHCSPLLINPIIRKASYVEQICTPLGILQNPNYTTVNFTIAPQESLVLFTDGMVEGQNKDGIILGYDGFSEMSLRSYNPDAENFYNDLFDAYLRWCGTINDDLTLIVINNQGQNDA